jgi:hypothetical protein
LTFTETDEARVLKCCAPCLNRGCAAANQDREGGRERRERESERERGRQREREREERREKREERKVKIEMVNSFKKNTRSRDFLSFLLCTRLSFRAGFYLRWGLRTRFRLGLWGTKIWEKDIVVEQVFRLVRMCSFLPGSGNISKVRGERTTPIELIVLASFFFKRVELVALLSLQQWQASNARTLGSEERQQQHSDNHTEWSPLVEAMEFVGIPDIRFLSGVFVARCAEIPSSKLPNKRNALIIGT